MRKSFKDDFGNTATITTKYIRPYKDAKHKEISYVLTLTSDYNNDFVYFVSVYDSTEAAINKLSEFSCNTFKEI